MKKSYVILLISTFLLILSYFVSQVSFDKTTNEARKLIMKHAEYINNKNWEGYVTIVDDMLDKIPSHVKTIDNIKVLWIGNSKKKITTKLLPEKKLIYDARVFRVVYFIKNSNITNPELAKSVTGIAIDDVVIVKETKESPWLYSSLGEYELFNK